MAEEPTLPKLPAVSWDFETQTFANTRKRARDGQPSLPVFSNSSDPAVFSSDDDPGVENYTQGRHRKKRYIGSWFQQHPTSSDSTFSEISRPPPKTRRTFKRQLDSGVWMGSDNSVDTEDDTTPEINTPAESKLQLKHARPVMAISPSEATAREVIQHAIDTGTQVIDLSYSGIESLTNATVSQLSILDATPLIDESFPFEPKERRIEVYLSNNPLIRAPGALFNLEHLTVLSLRNTKITELPPSIGKLRNLETLNISLARVRYLPWELSDLMRYPSKLRTLTVHPSPLYRPDDFAAKIDSDAEIALGDAVILPIKVEHDNGKIERLWLNKEDGFIVEPEWLDSKSEVESAIWDVRTYARSRVQYHDGRGFIISNFQLPQSKPVDSPPNSTTRIETEDLSCPPAPPPALGRSKRYQSTSTSKEGRVLSLSQLALLSCARAGRLRELESYLPPNAPPHLVELVDRIAERSEQNADCGDLICSVCRRRILVPMAQWIEWCSVAQFDLGNKTWLFKSSGETEYIPFLKRGCSWGCLPKPIKLGQSVPGTVSSVFAYQHNLSR
ncbi:hypothetical protein F5Y06DRAFT_237161 [Hypoxylon sp. FL0890]|nr:hypothetical protein F5Y06DRAFT_237161 [Hypoxylon sp. FL0890]